MSFDVSGAGWRGQAGAWRRCARGPGGWAWSTAGSLRAVARLALLLALLLPAACSDLQPLRGRPGRTGARLAIPLALRLAVAPPTQALLTDEAAKQLAEALATALQAEEVPATATDRPMPLDWHIDIVAESAPRGVVAKFRLLDADGHEQGVVAGQPMPAQVWTNPGPGAFAPLAGQAARAISTLLLQVDAARKQMDPVALAGGPARVRFALVSGAPGDGNAALTARMREFLSRYGYVMQEVSDGATFGLEGRVNLVPLPNGQQRVEIVWRVSRRDGEELGQVVQMNEVPAGTLNRPWGDVAYVVAEEASGGIRQVLVNATTAEPATSAVPPAMPPGLAPVPPGSTGPNGGPPPLPAGLPGRGGNPLAMPPAR